VNCTKLKRSEEKSAVHYSRHKWRRKNIKGCFQHITRY